MDVVYDDAKAGFRRIEVLTGPARRRRWSEAEKGRIVAETLQAGATVTEVARRWEVCPQQVWGWRRQARDGHLALPEAAATPRFVPLVAEVPPLAADEARAAARERTTKPAAVPSIESRLAGAVVRVPVGTDGALLMQVLRALRASAA
jgi:transposase